MRTFLGLTVIVSAALIALACTSSSSNDDVVTGDDQNLEEMPCQPLADIKCPPGYHTASTLNCPSGLGRCTVDGCEPSTTSRCLSGYVRTTKNCRRGAVRCSAPDGGVDAASDARDAATSPEASDARNDG